MYQDVNQIYGTFEKVQIVQGIKKLFFIWINWPKIRIRFLVLRISNRIIHQVFLKIHKENELWTSKNYLLGKTKIFAIEYLTPKNQWRCCVFIFRFKWICFLISKIKLKNWHDLFTQKKLFLSAIKAWCTRFDSFKKYAESKKTDFTHF